MSALRSDYDTEIRMVVSQRTLCRADVEKTARERYASLHQGKDSRHKNSHALVINSSSQGKSQSHHNSQGRGVERKFNGGRKKNGSNSNPKLSEKIPCERCGKHGHEKTACPSRICTKCRGRAHDATTCTLVFLTTVQSGKEEIENEANPSHIAVESITSCGNNEQYALLAATEDSPSSNAPGNFSSPPPLQWVLHWWVSWSHVRAALCPRAYGRASGPARLQGR
ncbi:unnamed protein product [Choristocarpus tenellus]